MLHIIGLGLADEKDVTVKGLETVKKCEKVYLEAYTSVLLVPKEKLEEFYGRDVVVADREMVESGIEAVLDEALTADVAFLVVGDPFGATTHADLVLRAKKKGVPVEVIHNASIMNAVAACGLQLYRFGETVSIPWFQGGWRPDSFYDKIKRNKAAGLHTLCLLDIKVKEPSLEAMARGKIVYEPPRFMTVNTAIAQLCEVEESRKEGVFSPDTPCVGVARIGSATQAIVYGPASELKEVDFGAPLHSMVIVGETHDLETEFLDFYRVHSETPRLAPQLDNDEDGAVET